MIIRLQQGSDTCSLISTGSTTTPAKTSTSISAGTTSSSVTPSITVDATNTPMAGSASELAANIGLGLSMFVVAVIPIPPSKHELRSHYEPLELRWNSSQ